MAQRGFSFIELMVTMAVLVTVSLIALPAFQTALGNAQIRTVAESIHHGLQLARVEAIKRNTKVVFSLGTDSAWQLGCATVSTTCPAVISKKNAAEGSGQSIAVTANQYTVTFTGLGGRDPAQAAALSQVDITNPTVKAGERRALRIVLASGGFVKVCDPAVTTAGDARKC